MIGGGIYRVGPNRVKIRELPDGTKLDGRPRLQLVVELDEMIHPWAVRIKKQQKGRDGNL